MRFLFLSYLGHTPYDWPYGLITSAGLSDFGIALFLKLSFGLRSEGKLEASYTELC